MNTKTFEMNSEELKEYLTELEQQDEYDQMSDDFYFTNGRRKAMQDLIYEVKMHIKELSE